MKATQQTWDEDTIAAMRPVVDVGAWPGVAGLRDVLGGAHLWLLDAGPRRALMALRGVQCEAGRVLDVVGLRSLGDRLQADELSRALDQLARDAYAADLLSMATRREHLVRGCVREGWTLGPSIVTKNLRLQ